MSKQVVTSAKFASIEVVDSAKFDNEIVFEDLDMAGTALTITASEDIAITSTGEATPWGVSVLAVGPITSTSTGSTNNITGTELTITSTGTADPWGVNVLALGPITSSSTESTNTITSGYFDGVANVDGSVVLGVNTATVPTAVVEAAFDATAGETRLGFFGATPVVQGLAADLAEPVLGGVGGTALTDTSTYDGFTLGQIVTQLLNLGIISLP